MESRVSGDAEKPSSHLLLVGSSGGHLAQLWALEPWWQGYPRRWVTFDKPDAESLLGDEQVVWAYHPTTRNIPNLIRNTRIAWRELRSQRPAVIISTGAAVAFPFFVLGRLFGIPTCYIEVYDRIDSPTVTGRICRPFTDMFLVQWPEQAALYRSAVVIGPLF